MMLNYFKNSFLCLFVFLLCSINVTTLAQEQTDTQRPAHWATPVNTSFNFYKIDDDLYRSEQPSKANLAEIEKLGIRTIISFRAFHSDSDILGDTGDIDLIRIPINTWNIKDKHVIRALNAIHLAKQKGPVLIHCQHGADRTGLITAMYRMIYQNWDKKAALDEMVNGGYGFHSIWTNIPKYIKEVDVAYLKQRLAYTPQNP